jgi:hypothetical protein
MTTIFNGRTFGLIRELSDTDFSTLNQKLRPDPSENKQGALLKLSEALHAISHDNNPVKMADFYSAACSIVDIITKHTTNAEIATMKRNFLEEVGKIGKITFPYSRESIGNCRLRLADVDYVLTPRFLQSKDLSSVEVERNGGVTCRIPKDEIPPNLLAAIEVIKNVWEEEWPGSLKRDESEK